MQSKSQMRVFSSAGSEHLPYKQRVGGSNPSTPTKPDGSPLGFLFICAEIGLARIKYMTYLRNNETIAIAMKLFNPYTLNLGGNLLSVSRPLVMGILNTTPDSFYAGSRCQAARSINLRIEHMAQEGVDIIDIGGYSSRSGADEVSVEEEYERVKRGMEAARMIVPDIPLSIDTFRAAVAERCIGEYGAEIINDISSGSLDEKMIATVGKCHAAYIMMHMRGNPNTMQSMCHYDNLTADILQFFARKIDEAASAGIGDIIIDPGFGFSKTLDQNYSLLSHLSDFAALKLPLLVGVSRKSMIYRLFDTTPDESLNGTTAINMLALAQGASILRVHDVKAAREAVEIFCKTFTRQ